jgi:ketosteroid isomerase-like protein
MKKLQSLLMISLAIAITIFFISSCNTKNETKSMENSSSNTTAIAEITAAHNQLYAGLNTMFTGDIEPLNNVWSHSDSITYMGPFGGMLKGWKEVGADFAKVAAMKLGGKITANNLHVYGGNDIGYTTCVEEGENISPDGNVIKVSHRATNIFHLEGDKWKLVHHHTDISSQLEAGFDKTIK